MNARPGEDRAFEQFLSESVVAGEPLGTIAAVAASTTVWKLVGLHRPEFKCDRHGAHAQLAELSYRILMGAHATVSRGFLYAEPKFGEAYAIAV